MSEYKRLDDIERREHSDLRWQWLIGSTFAVLLVATIVLLVAGP